ncbi:MAG: hypothetical protein ACLFNV_02085 [Desulfovibrionales bacterium]
MKAKRFPDARSSFDAMRKILANKPKDFALFVLGQCSTLNPSDILSITAGQVRNLNPGDELVVRTREKGGEKRVVLDNAMVDAFQNLLSSMSFRDRDQLFAPGPSPGKRIRGQAAHR